MGASFCSMLSLKGSEQKRSVMFGSLIIISYRCGSKFGIYVYQDIMRSLSSTVDWVTSISSVSPPLTPVPNISSFILSLVNRCVFCCRSFSDIKQKKGQQIKYFIEDKAQAQK